MIAEFVALFAQDVGPWPVVALLVYLTSLTLIVLALIVFGPTLYQEAKIAATQLFEDDQ